MGSLPKENSKKQKHLEGESGLVAPEKSKRERKITTDRSTAPVLKKENTNARNGSDLR